jgi:cell division protein CrgA
MSERLPAGVSAAGEDRNQESTVPKSRVRQKKVYTPPTDVVPRVTRISRKQSGIWLPITAVAMIVLGIGWLVVFYLSQGQYPVLSWRYWNLAVGFGAMVGALGLLARWR